MSTARQMLVLLGLTAMAAVATQWLHPRAPSWHVKDEPLREDEVTIEQIQKRWNNDVLWIDARPRSDFDKSHVVGALPLNEQERDALIAEHILVLQDNKKPVVVYCSSDSCQASRKIRDHLSQTMALQDVFVLRGGWNAIQKSVIKLTGP